jgi:TRAP transporter T-component
MYLISPITKKPMRLPALPACAGAILLLASMLLGGCSTSQLIARGASPLIDNGLIAMNRETDLEIARLSIPPNLKMIEALLLADPENTAYQVQAAMGFYGFAAGFVEDDSPERATDLYRRAYEHARAALATQGVSTPLLLGEAAQLEAALSRLDARTVPALFWTASAWAKWIEHQLDEPSRLAELPRVEALMRRVLVLDETYYHAGAHVFFGVYYGARAPMFGGDFVRAARHFDEAARINQHRLLLVEVYRAQYLLRQQGDRAAFHTVLTQVIDAPASTDPDLNLANAIARKKASMLLAQEESLF